MDIGKLQQVKVQLDHRQVLKSPGSLPESAGPGQVHHYLKVIIDSFHRGCAVVSNQCAHLILSWPKAMKMHIS